jgi:hypothetical protein
MAFTGKLGTADSKPGNIELGKVPSAAPPSATSKPSLSVAAMGAGVI